MARLCRATATVLIYVAVVTAIVVAIYERPVRDAGFTYDDKASILGNPAMLAPADAGVNYARVWSTDFWGREIFFYDTRCESFALLRWFYSRLGDCTPEAAAAFHTSTRDKRNKPWSHLSYRPLVVASMRRDVVASGAATIQQAAPTLHRTNLLFYVLSVLGAAALFSAVSAVLVAATEDPPAKRRSGTPSASAPTVAKHLATRKSGPLRWRFPPAIARCLPAGRPLLATAIFAAHPLHAEVAANITTRAEAMAAATALPALALYLAARAPSYKLWPRGAPRLGPWATAAALACGLPLLTVASSLCKEQAVLLPAVAGVLEGWLALSAAVRAAARANASGRARQGVRGGPLLAAAADVGRRALPMLARPAAALVACQALLYWLRIQRMLGGYSLFFNELFNPVAFRASLAQRVLGVAYLQALALSMLAFPLYQSHSHAGLAAPATLADPRLVLVPAVAVAVAAIAIPSIRYLLLHASSRKPPPSPPPTGADGGSRETRGVSSDAASMNARAGANVGALQVQTSLVVVFSLAFAAITFLPASHVLVVVGFQVAERALFLPSVASALLAASAITMACPSVAATGPPARARRVLAAVAAVALLLAYGRAARVQAWAWESEEALLVSDLHVYPRNNTLSLFGLGIVRQRQERFDEAMDLLEAARDSRTPPLPLTRIAIASLHFARRPLGPEASAVVARDELWACFEEEGSTLYEHATNLGILLLSRQEREDRGEYYVLVAHQGHGRAPDDPNIALLASNAGAARMVSPSARYGHARLAVDLLHEACRAERPETVIAAWTNYAIFLALHGRAEAAAVAARHALTFHAEGIAKDSSMAMSVLRVVEAPAAAALLRPWAEEEARASAAAPPGDVVDLLLTEGPGLGAAQLLPSVNGDVFHKRVEALLAATSVRLKPTYLYLPY